MPKATLNDSVMEIGQVNASVIAEIARVWLETGLRLSELQYAAAQSLWAEGTQHCKELFDAPNTEVYDSLRGKLSESSVHRARDYLTNVYRIASEAQAEFARLGERSLSQFNESVRAALSKAAEELPGAEIAASALQSTLSATTAAVYNIAQATKQVTGLAESGTEAVVRSAGAASGAAHAAKRQTSKTASLAS